MDLLSQSQGFSVADNRLLHDLSIQKDLLVFTNVVIW